jgi:hypothetical protein
MGGGTCDDVSEHFGREAVGNAVVFLLATRVLISPAAACLQCILGAGWRAPWPKNRKMDMIRIVEREVV